MSGTIRTPMRHGDSCNCRLCAMLQDEQHQLRLTQGDLREAQRQVREQDTQIAGLKRQVHSLWEDRKALSRALSIVFSQIHIIEKGEGE